MTFVLLSQTIIRPSVLGIERAGQLEWLGICTQLLDLVAGNPAAAAHDPPPPVVGKAS